MRRLALATVLPIVAFALPGRAEEPQGASSPASEEVEPSSDPPTPHDADDPKKKTFIVSGYVEGFYQYNFNNPSNGISHYRGYDTRHNTFTLSNAVLDTGFRADKITARLALQFGHTPNTYYQEEPALPGAEAAGESGADTWKYLQRASVGFKAHEKLLLEAGLFLSVLSYESLAVKDNWNWSRANAFVRLPNYHTGVKATFEASDALSFAAGVFNGWNSVVDNNDEKTFLVQAEHKLKDRITTSLGYLGGVERDPGAPEGRAMRHLVDLWSQLDVTDWLGVAADAHAGLEKGAIGAHRFAGLGLYGRVKATRWLYFATRGDRVWEDRARRGGEESEPILFPVSVVTSGTATIDVRPVKGLSTRLEYRRDEADGDLYFRSVVTDNRVNAPSQDTLLLGTTAWF